MTCVLNRKPHDLVEIYRRASGDGPGMETVVRWCKNCGAVVVDADVDGRTAPGGHMPMRFPVLALEKARAA